MADIVDFPGATFGKINPETMARNLEKEAASLTSMVVVGFDKEGKFYFASSEGEYRENFWILENARLLLTEQFLEIDKNNY